MKKLIILYSLLPILFICTLAFNSTVETNQSPTIVTPPNEYWIEWDSKEGLKRQEASEYKTNLFKLLRFYEAQIRGTYCGIATAVVALNSLSIEAPLSQYVEINTLFTQEEFFDGPMGQILDPTVVKAKGLTLIDMSILMGTQPLKVETFEAATLSEDEIRNRILTSLNNPNQIVIGLYHRKILGQEGSGHWSPIAAYDRASDSFLLLDVARYKYPPAWIDAKTFIAAMREPNDNGISRGFIILDNQQP